MLQNKSFLNLTDDHNFYPTKSGYGARSNKVVYGYKVWYGRVIRFGMVGWVRSYQSAHPRGSTLKI